MKQFLSVFLFLCSSLASAAFVKIEGKTLERGYMINSVGPNRILSISLDEFKQSPEDFENQYPALLFFAERWKLSFEFETEEKANSAIRNLNKLGFRQFRFKKDANFVNRIFVVSNPLKPEWAKFVNELDRYHKIPDLILNKLNLYKELRTAEVYSGETLIESFISQIPFAQMDLSKDPRFVGNMFSLTLYFKHKYLSQTYIANFQKVDPRFEAGYADTISISLPANDLAWLDIFAYLKENGSLSPKLESFRDIYEFSIPYLLLSARPMEL